MRFRTLKMIHLPAIAVGTAATRLEICDEFAPRFTPGCHQAPRLPCHTFKTTRFAAIAIGDERPMKAR